MTQLEQIEAAATRWGAQLTLAFDLMAECVWTIAWYYASPVGDEATELIRSANRKSTAIKFLYEDLVRLGLIKET